MKETWLQIKQLDRGRASSILQQALQECEEWRKQKAEGRKRKREEAMKKPTTKHKTDS